MLTTQPLSPPVETRGKRARIASPIRKPVKKKAAEQAAARKPQAEQTQTIPDGWCLYNVAAFRRQRLVKNMGERLIGRAAGGVAGDTVRKIYAGRNDINLLTIFKVAQALDLSWSEVFGRGDDKQGLYRIPAKDETFKIGS